MEIILDFGHKQFNDAAFQVISGSSKSAPATTTGKSQKLKNLGPELINSHWPAGHKEAFSKVKLKNTFHGAKGETFSFHLPDGTTVLALGLGEKKRNAEEIRRHIASIFRGIEAKKVTEFAIDIDGFKLADLASTVKIMAESLFMTNYRYTEYLKEGEGKVKKIYFSTREKSSKKIQEALEAARIIGESINFARTLINHPPNRLHSEAMAHEIDLDAKENLKGIKIKILNKEQIKKEGMNLLLAVNAASQYEPRVVHLTYTPKKSNKQTKHIALVGKGLVFDTGGLCLKPGASMINMKFDMAGAASVYAAFRAAALLGCPHKLTCVLGITDNAVSATAIMPDSVVRGRSGKSVEILNTDAEGRLVLADCFDYTCDLEPNELIDAATLTGACLVAVGSEVCAIMGNSEELSKKLLSSAKDQNENMWPLPIIEEFRSDIKSKIADIKNISSSRFAGTSKAAAFLEHFIKNNVSWAHLDIAGIADTQSYLPYCPSHGASGLIIRTLVHHLLTH